VRTACGLAILLALFALPGCVERAEPATYLVPAGLVGEVYIIFGVPDGEAPETRDGRRIYRIPSDGVLRTQFGPTYGWSTPAFFYVGPTEQDLVAIPQGPGSTIHDTLENRSNPQAEILAYVTGTTAAPVPGSPGSFSSDAPCSVKYASFFVGTRSQLLDRTSRLDITEYLKGNPVRCAPAV